jgi:uncharacterized integral membrane protein
MDEGRRRLSGFRSSNRARVGRSLAPRRAARPEVDRQVAHSFLVRDLRRSLAHPGGKLGAVRADQSAARRARAREVGRAEQAGCQRPDEPGGGERAEGEGAECPRENRNQEHEADPLDRALAVFAVGWAHARDRTDEAPTGGSRRVTSLARGWLDRVAAMAEPHQPQAQRKQSNWRNWALGIAVLLVIIFIVENLQEVEVTFLFINTKAPLIFALLIAAILGAVIGYVGPLVRRRGREE